MPKQQSNAPLYMQLRADLMRRISDGEFRVGDMLPTEEQLRQEYGVSRMTVRNAIDRLVADLLVVRRQGVGTFVAIANRALQSVILRGTLEDILTFDRTRSFVLISNELVIPPPEIADILRLSADQHTHRTFALTRLAGEPLMAGESYFPAQLVRKPTKRDFGENEQPTLHILERAGIAVARAEQSMQARAVPDHAAEQLGIAPRTPVIEVNRTYFSEADRPVAYIHGYYHPERYRIRAHLTPSGSRPSLTARTGANSRSS
jgi:GntR family transcriptional regulator